MRTLMSSFSFSSLDCIFTSIVLRTTALGIIVMIILRTVARNPSMVTRIIWLILISRTVQIVIRVLMKRVPRWLLERWRLKIVLRSTQRQVTQLSVELVVRIRLATVVVGSSVGVTGRFSLLIQMILVQMTLSIRTLRYCKRQDKNYQFGRHCVHELSFRSVIPGFYTVAKFQRSPVS